jgi:hypothetical protein
VQLSFEDLMIRKQSVEERLYGLAAINKAAVDMYGYWYAYRRIDYTRYCATDVTPRLPMLEVVMPSTHCQHIVYQPPPPIYLPPPPLPVLQQQFAETQQHLMHCTKNLIDTMTTLNVKKNTMPPTTTMQSGVVLPPRQQQQQPRIEEIRPATTRVEQWIDEIMDGEPGQKQKTTSNVKESTRGPVRATTTTTTTTISPVVVPSRAPARLPPKVITTPITSPQTVASVSTDPISATTTTTTKTQCAKPPLKQQIEKSLRDIERVKQWFTVPVSDEEKKEEEEETTDSIQNTSTAPPTQKSFLDVLDYMTGKGKEIVEEHEWQHINLPITTTTTTTTTTKPPLLLSCNKPILPAKVPRYPIATPTITLLMPCEKDKPPRAVAGTTTTIDLTTLSDDDGVSSSDDDNTKAITPSIRQRRMAFIKDKRNKKIASEQAQHAAAIQSQMTTIRKKRKNESNIEPATRSQMFTLKRMRTNNTNNDTDYIPPPSTPSTPNEDQSETAALVLSELCNVK